MLDVDNNMLLYTPTKKLICKGSPQVPFLFFSIDLSFATGVREGWTTDKFKHCERRARRNYIRQQENKTIPPEQETWKEENCFSIIFPAVSKTIDLVADATETRDLWVQGIRHVIELLVEPKEHTLDYFSFVRKQFNKADVNQNGSLSVEEIKDLYKSFNLFLDTNAIKKAYSVCN